MPLKRGRSALETSSQTSPASSSSFVNSIRLRGSSSSSQPSSSDAPVKWTKRISNFFSFSPANKRAKLDAQDVKNGQLLLTNDVTMSDPATHTPPASGFLDLTPTKSPSSSAEASSIDTQLLLTSQEGAICDPLGRISLSSSPATDPALNDEIRSSSEDAEDSQIPQTSPPSSPHSAAEPDDAALGLLMRESTDSVQDKDSPTNSNLEATTDANDNENDVDGPVPTDADVDHIQAVADAKVGDGIEGPLDWSRSPVDEAPHGFSAPPSKEDSPSDMQPSSDDHTHPESASVDVVDLVSDSEDSNSQSDDPDKENDVSLATPLLDSSATLAPFPSHDAPQGRSRARRSRHSLNGPMAKEAERKFRFGAHNGTFADSIPTVDDFEAGDISAIEQVSNIGRQTSFLKPKRGAAQRSSTPLQRQLPSRDRSYSFSSNVSIPSISAVSHKTHSSTYKKRKSILNKKHEREVAFFRHASIKRKVENAIQSINNLRSHTRKPLFSISQFEELAIKRRKVHKLVARDNPKEVSRVNDLDDLVRILMRQRVDAQTAILPLPPMKLAQKERMEREARAKMRRLRGVLGRKPLPPQLAPEQEEAARIAFSKRGRVSDITGASVDDQDIQKLRPGQWLNDEVINFYGTLILNRANEAEKKRTEAIKAVKDAPAAATTNGKVSQKNGKPEPPKRPYDPSLDAFWRVHYFSSFFWTSLKTKGFDGVKRWTRRIDIFSKDIILFPINLGNSHWVCGAINMRKHRFEYYDSLGARNHSAFTLMRTYVTEEARDKKKKEIDLRGWTDLFSDQSPQQENGYDCGVFASQTLEQISRRSFHRPIPLDPPTIMWKDDSLDETAGKINIGGADGSGGYDSDDEEYEWNFEQQNMPYLRKRMACEIYSKHLLD